MARANPNPKRAERGLSLPELMKYAVPYTKAKSRDIVIKRMTPKQTKGKMPAVVAQVQSVENNKRGDPHKVTVIGLDAAISKVSKQKKVLVDCDCGEFTFRCEYALWTWGAAKILRCNGEPATVTNSGNYPLTCKHIYRVLKEIKSSGM